MQVKSSASLQGALFLELKELLALVGDPKKSKEQLELLAEDISVYKELYQKNQQESEKLEKLKAEVSDELSKLEQEKTKNKEEKDFVKKLVVQSEQAKLLADSEMKKLNLEKAEFAEYVKKENEEIESKSFKVAKEKSEASESKKKADSIIFEYEEKLSKLKAMVG